MRPLPLLAPRHRGAVRRRKERVKRSGCIHVRGKRLCAWQRNNPGGIWMKVMRVGWVCCAVGMLIGAAAARCGERAGMGHEMSDWEEISDQRVAELRAISRHCQRPPQMHPYRRLMARLKASLRLWLREVPSQSKR